METTTLLSAPTVTNVRTWNALCHASALLGVFLHFPGHLLGPLIVWLVKRGDSPDRQLRSGTAGHRSECEHADR